MTTTIQGRAQNHINAPVADVWAALAEDFAGIGTWASGVNHAEGAGRPVGGSLHSERACEIAATGFNDTKERILDFDTDRHVLRYQLYDGLPGFVENAENTWTLREERGGTRIVGVTEMRINGIMGKLMGGFMTRNTNRVLEHMAEELKHYVETGRPHPRKAKAAAKYQKKLARAAA